MGYTPAQKASIEHVQGPLLISAGAGSGKTFTLTRRIAWALTPGSAGAGRAAVEDIDQVLAITFTEKAAREIKARVRSTLRQAGLVDQALKVDAAWISTIHGMCSRILRERALDLGLDPAFRIVGEQEQRDLRDACIEEALGTENEIVPDERFGGLLQAYGARGDANSVQGMLACLLDTASGLMEGLDAFDFGPEAPDAVRIATFVRDAYDDLLAIVEAALSTARKPSETLVGAQAGCAQAVAELDGLIEAGLSKGLSHRELLEWASGSFSPGKRGGDAYRAAVDELRRVRAWAVGECEAAIARPHAQALLTLAREVEARYEARLRERGALDMDGLLRTVLRAFRERPDVREAYADRFKLVMVDEFQDTSQLQVDMISYLTGERDERLCTVGDAQQSIYAFRGADVAVYEDHKARMRSAEIGALDVRLDANFRSHADILAFAERVFSQEEVFGAGFLHLDAGRDESRVRTPYRGSAPRIDLVDVTGEKGVVADDRADFAAEAIADRFEALRAEGHEPRDMVLLLGTMTRSVRYAEVLRAHGFDCVITGGSTFASFPEVRTVGALLNALANPADTRSLFTALTGPLFGLTADDLVDLSTKRGDDGLPRRRSIAEGLRALSRAQRGSARLRAAVETLERAWRQVGTVRPSRVLSRALHDCGVMGRLDREGAQGSAQAANLLKAVRLVEDFEADGAGMSQVALSFERFVAECGKDKPGALSASERNYVQIMTVHASKGLEFPIVALADCWKVPARETAGCLLAKHARGRVLCSLVPAKTTDGAKKVKREGAGEDEEPSMPLYDLVVGERSPHAYRERLKRFIAQEALEERRRCFYVAVTRASEALIAVFTEERAPIVEDVRGALCGDADWPESDAALDYGGSEPARFSRVAVSAADRDAYRAQQADRAGVRADFLVPRWAERPCARLSAWDPVHDGMYSYTALSAHEGADDDAGRATEAAGEGNEAARADEAAGGPDGLFDAEWLEIETSLADAARRATDLGTAFHLTAQRAVLDRKPGEPLACPPAACVRAIERACGVSADQSLRLRRALERWFGSELAKRAAGFSALRAEVPFCRAIPEGEGEGRKGVFFLEGEIDLLCADGKDDAAFVVDYKTGGRAEERPDGLRAKHALQAQCYALAVLDAGYPAVDLHFVRVEQEDAARPGEPQEVVYRFGQEDVARLEDAVRTARRSAR